MKLQVLTTLLIVLIVPGATAQTITLTSPPNGDNQLSEVTQYIGLVAVTISYHGPDVHGPNGEDRTGHIWGELVHYGLKDTDNYGTSLASPWRAGSNEITKITVSHDVKINGKDLKAGVYGVYLMTDKDKPWTWIFNKNSVSWGGYYYDSAQDVLRVEATAKDAPYTEWLTYGFDDRQLLSCSAYLQWENKRVGFKIDVPNGIQLYVDKMRDELTTFAGFNSSNWLRNAQFCLRNNTNLEEALKWVDISMNTERFNGQKTFGALSTKSDILTALNRPAEAQVAIKEAIPMGTVSEIHQYGRTLLAAGKKEEALDIFKQNRELHKDDSFTTFVGLARGYTAVGNKKEAIKNWEAALKNVPENQKTNIPAYQEELRKLKGV